MFASRRGWFSLVLALLFLVPLVPAGEPAQPAPEAVPEGPFAYVRIHLSETDAATLGPGVEVVERYDSFVLARATEGAIARLEDRGVTVVSEDTFTLHMNGYAFDTRLPVLVPPILAAPDLAEGRAYEIVQFRGPVKEEWLWRLEASGAVAVGYVPNNAFVVRATRAQLAAIAELPEVQWTGAYHPAFRISPDLLAAEGLVTIKVITFGGESVAPVVAALNKAGLREVGRWGDGPGILAWGDYASFGLVRARVDPRFLVPLARMNGVQYIEPQLEMQLYNQQEQFVLQTNATVDPGTRRIWDLGIRGELQTIALSDTGLDYDHTAFRHSQTQVTVGDIYNVTMTTRRKVIRYLPMSGYVGVDPWTGGDPNAIKDGPEGFCGSGHGTKTSSAAAGDEGGITPDSLNDGMARNAKLVMLDIGSVDTVGCGDTLSYIPDDYGVMFGAAYASPTNARIFSNSWGTAISAYTLEASLTDRFMWTNQDALVLFANGNNPPNPKVGSPATAKNVLSVGAASTWNNREAVGGVSRGNTDDGRLKPDMGTIYSTVFPGGTSESDGDLTSLNSGDGGFGGTSYATPLAAGMAALARQYFLQGWYPRGQSGGVAIVSSAALMKATLTASSLQMIGMGSCPPSDAFYPNNAQGWGRLSLDEALYFAGDTKKLFVVDHRFGIQTGDTLEYKVRVGASGGRLRAILAWTDVPGMVGQPTAPKLVNNLDLEVIDPLNVVYRGNVRGSCGAGQSVPGGTFDTLNNLEGVARSAPAVGEWRFRVIGANIPMGPQRFALVVVSDLDRTYGIVELDKVLYNEADLMTIQVTDGDATGNLVVQVTSNTEPAGETVTLTPAVPNSNIWRSTPPFPTHYGVPTPGDGRLQVSHGDTITVTYNDVSPPHASTATARVEIDPPAISNVRVTSLSNAAATIEWDTDKPSDSTVYYGTTIPPTVVASDAAVTTTHAITLTGLSTDTLYYYDVASSRVGRSTRDDNGGRHYRFRTTERAEILLVIGGLSFYVDPVRREAYRDALASASWSWNEWDIARQGDPSLATLQEYKVVLWQTGLESYPPFTDVQTALLRNYVNGGGRLFLTGHDHAWAACDPSSSFASPSRCSFVQSIEKGDYAADPTSVSQEQGIALDPISDIYRVGGTPGPVAYVGHRPAGGADKADEVTLFSAGGASAYVWQTNTGDVPPFDSVRWESSANNGTAGPTCVWCGAHSRVVTYFFEFTGINYVGVKNNPARTDILNKTIVWLLGRAPPVVRVSSPGAAPGEVYTTNSLTVTWQRSQPLASQEIWYSSDANASWSFVKTVGSTSASDTIDISDVATWPNGCSYTIRVVVYDTGSPQFKTQDASNFPFCILRPGGDVQGPIVRGGSLRLFPNPVREGATVTINATIDDTLRGMSDIFAAEYFVQATEPTTLDYGNGQPMVALTGFDSPVEAVQATFTAPWAAGTMQTVWVHGLDDATPTRNWGDFANRDGANRSFLVIEAITVPPPDAPTGVQAVLTPSPTFGDVRITWSYSGPAIDKFQVYFSTGYDSAKTGYALLQDNIPPAQMFHDHGGAGDGDASSYFYYVRAVNAAGGANSVEQAAKFTRLLTGGWNLVSIPVTPVDTRLTTALQTMAWRTARTFVAGTSDPWRAAYAGRPGDLTSVSTGMALWIDLAAGDFFTIAGQVPASTTINLIPGWNFVGFAKFNLQNAQTSFTGLGVTILEGYTPTPQYYLVRLTIATTNLEAGRGYWVYVAPTGGGPWTVTN